MKLHASAALSLNQRRRLVCRVVKAGWSLTQAAEAAVGRPLPRRGRGPGVKSDHVV